MAFRAATRRVHRAAVRPFASMARPATALAARRATAAEAAAPFVAARAPVREFAAAAADAAATASPIQIEVNDKGIAIVTLDMPGEKVNTLSQAMNAAFEKTMATIESDPKIRAAVLISGKSNCFIAGADIKMLDACKTAAELSALSRGGQQMMDRIAASKKPIVAAINGDCLGGGLEVALACHYRIATTHPKTKLGLPEVQLGLLPGAGGTQRLPRLVGIQKALTMMTTGQRVDAERAKKMGLVDIVADPFALKAAALQAAEELANGTLKSKRKQKPLIPDRLLEDNPIGRAVLFSQAEKMIESKAGRAYPAPFEILRVLREGVEKGHAAGSAAEADAFGKLGMTSQSAALRSIFFASTELKKNPFPKATHPIDTVAVLGAGLMGAGIAQVSAVQAGRRVLLKDRDQKGLVRGEAQIQKNLDGSVKKKKIRAFDRDVIMSRVVGLADDTPNWRKQFGKADLVIEAVFEDLGLKHKVIRDIEPSLPAHAIFATNTSALPIARVAEAAARPERVIGMHYFSPVDKMPLLEIIPHAGTDPAVTSAAFDFGLKQGKTVIVVKDVPGFYVNRCLGPFMAEVTALLREGVPPEKLDRAMKDFGFPVGPVTLADEVGIDVASHVQSFLGKELGDRMAGGDPAALQEMVSKGLLGRKSGKGFYTYGSGKSKEKTLNPDAVNLLKKYLVAGAKGDTYDDKLIADRMSARFVKEALLCLQDGIIRSAADGDIGAVFGIGFPPFRGGPFRHVDAVGAQKLVDQMNKFADQYGSHFSPPQILVDYAKAGKTFRN